MNFSQKRKSERLPGEIPLMVKRGEGRTVNFSSDGLYFLTDQELTVGERTEVVLLLDHTGLGEGVRLSCQGEVLRVDKREHSQGIAFVIRSHRIASKDLVV